MPGAGALAEQLATVPAAPTAEQQAMLKEAQEVTGWKWGAYLVAWGAWLAFDVYRQNSKKEEEAAAAAAADQAAPGSSGGDAAGGSEDKS